jgi:Tol biopolymer transport system component
VTVILGRPPSRRGFLTGATALAAIIAMGVGISVAVVPAGDAGASVLSKDDGAVSLASAAPSQIALIRTSTDHGGVRLELYLVNTDGSGSWRLLETARLSSPPGGEHFELGSRPAWSPDGRTIAFVGMGDDGNVDVYVVGADGLGQQRLTRHPGVDGNPAWSPDGRKIAFTRRAREWGAGKTYIYVMNADGSGQRRLTHGHVHFSVAWSPDGRKMLFERPNPRDEEIYIMNSDGSGQRRLTRDPERDLRPVWSPDGRQIAWMRDGISVMNPDGSDQRSLTPAAHLVSGFPAWSPDGRKIAFTGGQRSILPHGVLVMNADGSERRRLTQRGALAAWSPDGQMIAFDRAGGTARELVVMTADGRGKRRLMRTDGWPGTWHWAWSPTLPKRQ